MDSQYVSRTLGRCLAEGLAELIELRPLDPIEFLSLWILKYKEKQQLELQKSARQTQLEEERRRIHEDTLHQQLLQEEENRIRAEQIQCVPEPAEESRPGGEERDAAADPVDHTESETVNELNDQVIDHMTKASALPHQEEETSEDQTSELLNPEEDRSDTQNESNEADAPSEENQPGAEKPEDSEERHVEKEEDEEDDGAEATT